MIPLFWILFVSSLSDKNISIVYHPGANWISLFDHYNNIEDKDFSLYGWNNLLDSHVRSSRDNQIKMVFLNIVYSHQRWYNSCAVESNFARSLCCAVCLFAGCWLYIVSVSLVQSNCGLHFAGRLQQDKSIAGIHLTTWSERTCRYTIWWRCRHVILILSNWMSAN